MGWLIKIQRRPPLEDIKCSKLSDKFYFIDFLNLFLSDDVVTAE